MVGVARTFIVLVLIAHSVPGLAIAQSTAPPHIVVTGTGRSMVMPDRATIELAVETRAARPADAAADNARRQRAILAALHAAQISEKEIATIGYNVQPDWQYDKGGNRKLTGYIARSTIRVQVDALDVVGSVVDTALAAGATVVSSIRFTASRADEARREALEMAVKEARADAEVMAGAAGGHLGRLIELTAEAGPTPREALQMTALRITAEERDETPILPGVQTVTATVLGRWQFTQP